MTSCPLWFSVTKLAVTEYRYMKQMVAWFIDTVKVHTSRGKVIMSEEVASNDRKHTRLSIQISAEIRMDDGTIFEGTTRNMSFGGAFVDIETVPENVQLGTHCELRLKLGASEQPLNVPVKSKLVRTTTEGLGVEFLATTIEGYWHFKNLMVYNSPESDQLLQELETHPGLTVRNDSN